MVNNKKFKFPASYAIRASVLVAALGFACLCSLSARAQGTTTPLTRIEVSGAYSYINAGAADSGGTFNVHGGSASVAYNLNNWVGLVADLGGYHFTGLPAGLDSNMYTYLFGPRFSFRNSGRIIPFAQVLFGGGRLNASSGGIQAGENGFATAIGGGVDLPLYRHLSLRVLQAEYVLTRFPRNDGSTATQNNIRISTGLVIRFGSR
jgi:hypothetical protein